MGRLTSDLNVMRARFERRPASWSIARSVLVLLVWAFIIYQSIQIAKFQAGYSTLRQPILKLGEIVRHRDRHKVEFRSWSNDPAEWSWSIGRKASIIFRLEDQFLPGEACAVIMELLPGTSRSVELSLNKRRLASIHLEKRGPFSRSFPCERLRKGLNRLDFEFPGVTAPRNSDVSHPEHRLIAIGLVSIAIDRLKRPAS
jgi:hypothetical protein